jgi:ribosomal-protein-alanine N-acetyltransferase
MIRRADSADVGAISGIELICFGDDAWSTELVRDEIEGKHRTVLVADNDGELEAYGSISVLGDLADLNRVAVVPSRRRHGSGGALLAGLIDRAREQGATRMLLEVADTNAAAIALYASLRFTTISRRGRYYPDGADALVMELDITATG